MYVYSEEQGRVVQHRPRGDQASRWNSLESVEIGSVWEIWGNGHWSSNQFVHTLMLSISLIMIIRQKTQTQQNIWLENVPVCWLMTLLLQDESVSVPAGGSQDAGDQADGA